MLKPNKIEQAFREIAQKHEEPYQPQDWLEMQECLQNQPMDLGSTSASNGQLPQTISSWISKGWHFLTKGLVIAGTTMLLPASQNFQTNQPETKQAFAEHLQATVSPALEEQETGSRQTEVLTQAQPIDLEKEQKQKGLLNPKIGEKSKKTSKKQATDLPKQPKKQSPSTFEPKQKNTPKKTSPKNKPIGEQENMSTKEEKKTSNVEDPTPQEDLNLQKEPKVVPEEEIIANKKAARKAKKQKNKNNKPKKQKEKKSKPPRNTGYNYLFKKN